MVVLASDEVTHKETRKYVTSIIGQSFGQPNRAILFSRRYGVERGSFLLAVAIVRVVSFDLGVG